MSPDAKVSAMRRFAAWASVAGGSITLLDDTTDVVRNVTSSTDCCNVSIWPWINARCAIVSLSLLALELPACRELFNPPR